MARRRRRRQDRDEVQRGDTYTSRLLLDEYEIPVRRRQYVEPYSLLDIEDRRRWDPEGEIAPARSVRGPSFVSEVYPSSFTYGGALKKNVPLRGRPFRSPFLNTSRFEFDRRRNPVVCVRRKQRREVLFAKRRTGKGSKSPRHRNYWSDVECGRS